jgi:hypothetical protein
MVSRPETPANRKGQRDGGAVKAATTHGMWAAMQNYHSECERTRVAEQFRMEIFVCPDIAFFSHVPRHRICRWGTQQISMPRHRVIYYGVAGIVAMFLVTKLLRIPVTPAQVPSVSSYHLHQDARACAGHHDGPVTNRVVCGVVCCVSLLLHSPFWVNARSELVAAQRRTC